MVEAVQVKDLGGEIAEMVAAEAIDIGWHPGRVQRETTLKEQPNLYDKVTSSIIAQLEQGAPPWVKPWAAGHDGQASGMPHNGASNREYGGINTLLLWAEAAHKGYSSPAWFTMKQIKELGARLKPKTTEQALPYPGFTGQEATMIVYWGVSERDARDRGGDQKAERFRFLKRFFVFNRDQIDNLPDRVKEPIAPDRSIETATLECAQFVEQLGVNIAYGGSKAFYRPSTDMVQVPASSSFLKAAKGDVLKARAFMQATILHEVGHWTGSPLRAKRPILNRFGSDGYAREELVAEIFSAFLCARFGLPGILRHASYLGSWLSILREDNRAIFTAAAQAKKAAEWCQTQIDDCLYPASIQAAE